MTIHEKIKDEKLQFNIYRETAKILTFSSAKINKYEYLKDEEISLWFKPLNGIKVRVFFGKNIKKKHLCHH